MEKEGWVLPFLVLALALFTPAEGVRGQQVLPISPEGACVGCVVLVESAVFGARSGELAEESRYVSSDAAGRVWVNQGDRIEIFAGNGTHLQTLGRRGEGPREFLSVLAIHPHPSGEMMIFDFNNQRLSFVDDRLEFVSQFRLEGITFDVAVLNEDVFVANQRAAGAARFGYPMHQVSISQEEVVRSFGKPRDAPSYYPPRGLHYRRAVEPLGSATVLAAPRTEPALEEWSVLTGDLIRRWERDLPWFEPYQEPTPYSLTNRPSPYLDAIHVDDRGRAWVFYWRAEDDWAESLTSRIVGGQEMLVPESNDSIYETVIEVWDLDAGRVLATGRSDMTLHGFLPDGRVYGVSALPDGTPIVTAFAVSTRF